MLHTSTKRLIDRLSEMTAQRKIDWANGEQQGSLVYDTEGYRVVLEGDPADLILCDALGKELERANADLLGATKHVDGGTYGDILGLMRVEAVRIARGTEDAIASVLEGLQPEDTAPEETTLIPEDTPVAPDEAFSTPIADAMEDNADEMSAATPDIEQDFSASPEADWQEESAPENDFAAYSEESETFASEPTEPAPFDESVDHAEVTDAFDDTPDVGKAVADLADQVNETAPEQPVEPAIETPAPQRDEATMRAATSSNFATSSFGMPNNLQGLQHGSVKSEPTVRDENGVPIDNPADAPPIVEEKPIAPTLEPIETFDPAETDSAFTFEEPVLRPGQSFSLSGLAAGETTTPTFTPPAPPAPEPEPEAPPAPEPVIEAAPIPEAPVQAAEPEAPATPQPPAPEEELSEEEAKPEPTSKRFNPWV